MAPDDSLVDTAPSMDYRWARDSWISENHPTVDVSADRTTFVRSELNSAKKEEVRRLARYLDSYKSPKPRTILQSQLEKSLERSMLLPQASSSPKSDSYALRNSQQTGCTTPALTHRSMSPTPTSQSTSWHKHSMRLSTGNYTGNGALSSGAHDTFLSSTSPHVQRESLVKSPQAEDFSGSNFRPVQVCPVEDSHWKGLGKSQYIHQSEITPSPAKQKEEFYTAKQFVPTMDRTIEVDSLDITRPALYDSPTVRRPMSSDSPHDPNMLNDRQTYQDERFMPDHSQETSSTTKEFVTHMGTAGDLTRSASEHGSDLSKVDSQDISLQRAISVALQDQSKTNGADMNNDFGELPLEEAIAARFRQSLMEKSHTTTERRRASTNELRDLMPAQVTLPHVQTRSPDHVNVPRETEIVTNVKDEKDQADSTELNNSHMAEMLEALERVTEECSRRGHMIDELAENVVNPMQTEIAIVEALDMANKRSQELEVELQQYREQVQQMAKDLQKARSVAQSRPSSATSTAQARPAPQHTSHGQIELRPTPQPLRSSLKVDTKANTSTRLPLAMHAASNEVESEESFRDKVQRWEDNLEIVSNCGATMRQNDSISRAHEVLSRDLKFIPTPRASIQRTFAFRSPAGQVATEQLVTPREAQIEESSHLFVSKKPVYGVQPAEITRNTAESKYQNDPKVLHALRTAQAEIERLKLPETRTGTPVKPSTDVRPLTADMMPDAQDSYLCPEEKLFRRLQMARVEDQGSVALANLVKNILVQLDVPFERLVETITALGARGTTDKAEAEAQDTIVHETIKLREFAEHVHATLYGGDHIEGTITSPTCLRNMAHRVDKMQRAIDRSRGMRQV